MMLSLKSNGPNIPTYTLMLMKERWLEGHGHISEVINVEEKFIIICVGDIYLMLLFSYFNDK